MYSTFDASAEHRARVAKSLLAYERRRLGLRRPVRRIGRLALWRNSIRYALSGGPALPSASRATRA